MSWFLRGREPDSTTAPLVRPVPTAGAQFTAAFQSQHIEDDSWNHGQGHSRALRTEILEMLDPQDRPLPLQSWAESGRHDVTNFDRFFTEQVLARAAVMAEADPGAWASVPLTYEAFEDAVTQRRRAEYDEQQAVLGMGDSTVAQFLGRMAGASTDEISIATLPFGAGSLARGQAMRFMGSEAALSAASEAAILPRAQRTAEALNLPEPDAGTRILLGAATGGLLAGTMVGAARGLEYGRGVIRETFANRPAGISGSDYAAAVQAAEVDLRSGQPMAPAGFFATQDDALEMDAMTLLAVTGRDGALRAMIRLPDGTRLTGLNPGDTLPDGSQIAGIEAGRITITRDGQPVPVEIGGSLGTGVARPSSTPATARVESPSLRFQSVQPMENPVGYVFGRLLDLGYDPRTTSAIVGNLMQESGPALNTRAVGDNGNAYGMGQWNGPRRRALIQWAAARGRDVDSIDTQIDFLHHELQGPERAALQAILAAPDAETAARVASERFWRPGIPHVENRMGYAAAVQRQFDAGDVPQGGRPTPMSRVPAPASYGTDDLSLAPPSRHGMTRPDEVSSPAGTRVGVEWRVVELDDLRAATADLQPRDRSRAASDEQIAEIAARLDPVRLMPGPEADRGAPIIGPDRIVESGNGRVSAIRRAIEHHPERYNAYVQAIRSSGIDVPDGMRQPVLVGSRTTEMTPEQRVSWVRQNNTSPLARMGGAEQARMDAGYLSQRVMDALNPRAGLASSENGAFVRSMLGEMPQAERAAFYTEDGKITLDGVRRIQSALFAHAWDADDLVRMLVESPNARLRALLDMMNDLAPEWSSLRALVQGGYVRAEFDISAAITGMIRQIGAVRSDTRNSQSVLAALRDWLDQPDLLNPRDDALNDALLAVFYRGAQARRPADAGAILRRFAADAALIGRADADDLFGPPPSASDTLAAATARHDAHAPMPDPPAAPADIALPAIRDDVPDLPDAPEAASSPALRAIADQTEAEVRAAMDAPQRATERTAAGEQALINGLDPITQADRILARQAQPLDGGPRTSASQIGGLFDPAAAPRTDLFAADNPVAARPGTQARDAVALEVADYVALRDEQPFRLSDEGRMATLSQHMADLDHDAALVDLLKFCATRGK